MKMKNIVMAGRCFCLFLAAAAGSSAGTVRAYADQVETVLPAAEKHKINQTGPQVSSRKILLKIGKKDVTNKTKQMMPQETASLLVSVPADTNVDNIAFRSSSKSVVSVDKKGNLTAKAKGKAKITVTVTAENGKQDSSWMQVQVMKRPSGTDSTKRPADIGVLIPGSSTDQGFMLDNVLWFQDGTKNLHFHLYLPQDDRGKFDLYLALPGKADGAAADLEAGGAFALEAKNYRKNLIIAAPWGRVSAKQVIGLTEYLKASYNIRNVYISGYAEGGETLSRVLGRRPELYTAALHVSSSWKGAYQSVVKNRVPVYFAAGRKDAHYGSKPVKEAYQKLYRLYRKEGLTEKQIGKLLILNLKNQSYFTKGGIRDQHEGGKLFAYDQNVMGWLLKK